MTSVIDETHDPLRVSWVASANGHPEFPIQNLPLGVFSPPGGKARCGVAIGDKILDLRALATAELTPAAATPALAEATLNALLALPAADRQALRRRLSALLSDHTHHAVVGTWLHDADDCALHLPARIGDYTDFYVGIHHAVNVGKLFRPEAPLFPNYKYVPIGYHGRASSVRPSGAAVRRPKGQLKPPEASAPHYGPSRLLDYELELGVWIGGGNRLGEPIPIGEASAHIAGLSLLNDWSARDVQTWEYQPLGPFLAKNFLTTVSPWIVTTEALAPFRIAQPSRPEGDPAPLPYLSDAADQRSGALAVTLEVSILTPAMRRGGHPPHRLSRGAASSLYWTIAQLVAHHTSNGCDLNPGDLLGTGTISAPGLDGFGSLLELSHGGAQSIALPGGEIRCFLEDGDEVIFTAKAHARGFVTIGFGDCRGLVEPAS